MAHSTFTLRGKHTTPSGVAHTGSVKVTPNATLRDSAGGVVLSGTEMAILDDTGAWSLTLPCDSPGLNPATGIGYRIDYRLHATGINSQSFYATADLADTTLDASQIVSVATPSPLSAIVGPEGPEGPRGPTGLTGPAGPSPIAYDTDGTPYLV